MQCNDEYKCTDNTNNCIDIPIYNIRGTDGKCIIKCINEDRCIYNNECIEIPKHQIRDINGICKNIITSNSTVTSNSIQGNVITK